MEFRHQNKDKNELNSHLDLCAYCGGTILRGAMRCVSCGKMLKTPEEQSAAIREMEKNQKGIMIKKLMKLAVVFIASGVVYYFFADRIQEFVLMLLDK
jgi:uncharacterized membrane protein YvbJ